MSAHSARDRIPVSHINPDKGDIGSGPIMLAGVNGNCFFDNDLLSTHVLFVGSTGSGKTNAVLQLVEKIKNSMQKNDVMVIFDTKGDYLKEFYQDGVDLVLSHRNMDKASPNLKYASWNLFKEITADDEKDWDLNANEISRMLYDELISSSKDVFFPRAACDLTRATLIYLVRYLAKNGLVPNNKDLRRVLGNMSSAELKNLLKDYEDLKGVFQYISDESGQTKGVMATVQTLINDVISGSFALPGDFSVRQFVRGKSGKTLFIEYDLSYGRTLTPVYRLIFDLAIKECLGRESSEGNVFFIIDEFARLPNLYHVEDGISFGRSTGAKFIVGTQNVSQILEEYGEGLGSSILSNFGCVFSFRSSDQPTRDLIIDRYGKYRSQLIFDPTIPGDPPRKEMIESNVVEDLDLSLLPPGCAILSFPNQLPRRFQFKKYLARPIKFCTTCNHKLQAGVMFCPKCGNRS